MTARFYPWHAAHRERLIRLHDLNKLPHALLLCGPACLGKRDFAVALAGLFLCSSPNDHQLCGNCAGCHLFNAGTHPDFRLIEPEGSRQIVIDQIRELIEWVGRTAQRGGLKAVVVHPAEAMNANAANALLKCLEEPSGQTLIMLVSDMPGRLLPTIRSRCQPVPFVMPATAEALDWLREARPDLADPALLLEVAGGAPLALERRYDAQFLELRRLVGEVIGQLMTGGNLLALADKLVKGDPTLALEVMHSLFTDALRLSLTEDAKYIKNKDLGDIIKSICNNFPKRGQLAALDAIRREQLALAGSQNPNPQLLMESLMVEIAGFCAL